MAQRVYQRGDVVVSRPVGNLRSFKGTVVDVLERFGFKPQYVVKDEYGRTWCRSADELMLPRGRPRKETSHAAL